MTLKSKLRIEFFLTVRIKDKKKSQKIVTSRSNNLKIFIQWYHSQKKMWKIYWVKLYTINLTGNLKSCPFG